MIYALYWHEFALPCATTNQFSFEKHSSKREFLETLIGMLEGNKEPICNLDGDEEGEEVDRAIEEIASIRDRADVEKVVLSGKEWQYGCFNLRICFAEYYPNVIKGFRKEVLSVVLDYFEDYIGLSASEKAEYQGDNGYETYKALYSVNKHSSQEDFDRTFDMLMEQFGEHSSF